VTGPSYEFASGDPGDSDFGAALETLDPPFSTVAGPVRLVRRTWLDTFDWRLHGAGYVLEQDDRAGDHQLVLHGPDGASVAAPVDGLTWPTPATAFPPGQVRDRVEAVTDVRALLATGRMRSLQRDIRVLNRDGKTVVRLTVDVARDATASGVPALLTVTAVRGYQSEADRVAAAVARVPGVVPNETSRQEHALSASGRSYRDRAGGVVITHDMSAAEAVAHVLTGFRETLTVNLPGLLADVDSEFLHDVRVAVRRARSTLKLTGDVLPAEPVTRLGTDLKWLGDLTSPTRDLDVYLLGVPAMARGLRSFDPADLDPFRAHLQRRRTTAQRAMVRGLRSARFGQVLEQWRALDTDTSGDRAEMLVVTLAQERVANAHRRVLRLGSRIGPGSPAEDLHTLRKRCKELRYLLEIFAPLHDRLAHKRALDVLKSLQDCLGEFQDSEVQATALRRFAVEMTTAGTAPPVTLLAMGELAAALSAEQQRARRDFAGIFATFLRPKKQRRFDALLADGTRSEAMA
jgi:CHAD domain-containing protein